MYALVKFGQMRRAAGPAGDADMLAWAAAVVSNGGTVSTARKTIVETLIVGLKTDGIWSKLDRLWLLAAENSPSALTDLKARILGTAVSSPTFTADKGFQSASGGRIDTGFIPNAGGNIFALDSGHISIWQIDHAVSTSGGILGSRNDAGTSYIEIDYAGTATDIVPRVNNVGSPVSGLTGVTGFMHANRSASNAFQFYQNGASIGSNTDASVSPVSDNSITIGGLNGGGGFFATNDGQFAIMGVGGSLSSTEASNLFSRIRDYLLSIATISVTDSDTVSWVTSVLSNGGYVTNTRALAVQTLVTGLKSDGIWSKLDRLWLFAAENPRSALTDLKALALATVANSPTFNVDLGYQLNGSNQYINSGFTPSTAGGNYVKDSASAATWVIAEGTGATDYIGAYSIGLSASLELRANGVVTINSLGSTTFTTGSGLITVTRTGSGQYDIYKNGSSVGSDTDASSNTLDKVLDFGARNFDGSPDLFAACQLACGVIGGGLNSTEQSNLYSRLSTYMIAVGAITDDADVNNWAAKARGNGGTVSKSRQTLVYNLITGLKSDGVWSKLDRLWLFAAENTGSAQVDLKTGAMVTLNGPPTFTTDSGYAGDGSSKYIDTNFIPSTDGVAWASQNNAGYGFWVPSGSVTSGRCLMGARNSSTYTTALFFGGVQMAYDINDPGAAGMNSASTSLAGFWWGSRTASNVMTMYRNGSTTGSGGTEATNGNQDQEIYVLARDNSASADQFADASVSAAVIGAGLNGTDAGNLYTRLRTYMTAVGVP